MWMGWMVSALAGDRERGLGHIIKITGVLIVSFTG